MLTKELKEEIETLRVKEKTLEKRKRDIEKELSSLKYTRASHLGNLFDSDNPHFHTSLWKVFYSENGTVSVETNENAVISWFFEQVGELYDYGIETKYGKFGVTIDDYHVSININSLEEFVAFMLGVHLSIDVIPFSEAFVRHTAIAELCKKVVDYTLEKMNQEDFPKGTPQESGGRRRGTRLPPRPLRSSHDSSLPIPELRAIAQSECYEEPFPPAETATFSPMSNLDVSGVTLTHSEGPVLAYDQISERLQTLDSYALRANLASEFQAQLSTQFIARSGDE
jgi:hypothetical protein